MQALQITVDALLLGLACGLVTNNILVVNNYRDLEEDILASKRTLVVLLGVVLRKYNIWGRLF